MIAAEIFGVADLAGGNLGKRRDPDVPALDDGNMVEPHGGCRIARLDGDLQDEWLREIHEEAPGGAAGRRTGAVFPGPGSNTLSPRR